MRDAASDGPFVMIYRPWMEMTTGSDDDLPCLLPHLWPRERPLPEGWAVCKFTPPESDQQPKASILPDWSDPRVWPWDKVDPPCRKWGCEFPEKKGLEPVLCNHNNPHSGPHVPRWCSLLRGHTGLHSDGRIYWGDEPVYRCGHLYAELRWPQDRF